jgi:cyclase
MVTQSVNIPVIASGGMGKPEDAVSVVSDAGADAVAIAKILHYKTTSLEEVRSTMQAANLGVRTVQ